MGASILIWGIIFGSIGLGFFTYGRKQKAPLTLVVGMIFFIIPYLITNPYWLVPTGIVLAILPFVFRV